MTDERPERRCGLTGEDGKADTHVSCQHAFRLSLSLIAPS